MLCLSVTPMTQLNWCGYSLSTGRIHLSALRARSTPKCQVVSAVVRLEATLSEAEYQYLEAEL